jgi:hypothetical protein
VLGKALRFVSVKSAVEPGIIDSVFPQEWSDTENRRQRWKDSHDFVNSLRVVCSPGWLRVFESAESDTILERMTDFTLPPFFDSRIVWIDVGSATGAVLLCLSAELHGG